MFAFTRGRAVLDPYPLLRQAGVDLGTRYADIGCGGIGHFLFPAARLVGEEGACYGVDVDERPLLHLQREVTRRALPHVHVLRGDFERFRGLPIADESVDVVSASHVLELVARQEEASRELWRILRPGGLLLVVSFNPRGRQVFARAESGNGFIPYGFRHRRNLPPQKYHEAVLYERGL